MVNNLLALVERLYYSFHQEKEIMAEIQRREEEKREEKRRKEIAKQVMCCNITFSIGQITEANMV